jgi:hypothetical protein
MAELIAEHLQRPLIQVSTGELGTTADAVEQRLPRIFKRAARWKAVLLERRLAQDIHRNAIVCVFLRTLEYYQGVMFLTTNRVGQIDDAIASRIHFKLKYDKLSLAQQTNIWRHFLAKAATVQYASGSTNLLRTLWRRTPHSENDPLVAEVLAAPGPGKRTLTLAGVAPCRHGPQAGGSKTTLGQRED